MTHLSIKTRYRIVEEWERVQSITQTSKNLKIRKGTCKLWVDRYLATETVDDKVGRGRKPILSDDAAEHALDVLVANEHKGPADVAKTLVKEKKASVVVHRCTLQRAARKAARWRGKKLVAFRGKPKGKHLGAPTVKKRLEYCKERVNKSYCNVLFTDRCKFAFENPGCVVKPVVYGYEGEYRAITKVNHPKVFNVYGGFSRHGTTNLFECAGSTGRKSEYVNKKGEESKNITKAEYRDILSKGILLDALKTFRLKGQSSFVLLQDNDPTHIVAKEVLDEFNKKHGCHITLLGHPPNSPDLNPIENIWGLVKRRVDMRGCNTFPEFKEALREEFRNIPPSMLKNYVNSMHDRIVACQKAEGQRTRY
jgi:transposase